MNESVQSGGGFWVYADFRLAAIMISVPMAVGQLVAIGNMIYTRWRLRALRRSIKERRV